MPSARNIHHECTEYPMMVAKMKTRILLSKVGLDGHDRGVKVLAALLMKEGFEVTYLGLYNTPEMVVQSALEEDVDVIGISFLSGEHLTLTPKIVAEMKKHGLEDVLLIVGGIVPAVDEDALLKMGVKKVLSGEADAMVADMPACVLAVLRNPNSGLVTLAEPLSVEPMGIAVSAKDPKFYNLIDNFIDAFEGTGILMELRRRWFDNGDWVKDLP